MFLLQALQHVRCLLCHDGAEVSAHLVGARVHVQHRPDGAVVAKGKRREFGDVLLRLCLVVRVNDAINEAVNVHHVGLEEHHLLKNRVPYLGNLATAHVQHSDLLVPLSAWYACDVADASVDELRVAGVLFGVDEEYLRIWYLTLQTEVFTLQHCSHHEREQEGLAVLLWRFHHMNVAHRGYADAVL